MFNNPPKQAQIVSVTRLNRLARQILESEIGQVWVTGEISNFVAAASGHWYFTLKDNKAQVKTAMFKGSNRYLKFKPKAGDKVVVRANLSIYEARGDYQLIVEHMEPEGQGQLKQAYEALKLKLSQMGMFSVEDKQALPKVITRVGLVTSSTGAAVHDILTVMARRNPSIEVVIYPSLVQGELASRNIVQQIELANQRKEVDVLIVGRGGGSLEDLWAFNEEPVAHAIYNSALPVISAVGHEVDVTIADYVADVRAPTPSAAAELVSQDQDEKQNTLLNLKSRLSYAIHNIIQHRKASVRQTKTALNANHPQSKILQAQQSIDRLGNELTRLISRRIKDANSLLNTHNIQLQNQNPKRIIEQYRQRVVDLNDKILKLQHDKLEDSKKSLANLSQLMNSVSPLATLSRGYSISFCGEEIVKSISQLHTGQVLTTKLKDGEVTSQISTLKSN